MSEAKEAVLYGKVVVNLDGVKEGEIVDVDLKPNGTLDIVTLDGRRLKSVSVNDVLCPDSMWRMNETVDALKEGDIVACFEDTYKENEELQVYNLEGITAKVNERAMTFLG